ncbi:MAG: helix-turn-helix transcriptional regulator [Bacteroidales bacterium]|nr:helix-turn-helix transcriptional regulator [Bacteroidales bacterium]
MIQNALFRECLAKISPETRHEFDCVFSVAEKIDAAMKKNGITKVDLARQLNVTDDIVSQWLTGRYDFSLSQLVSISDVIGEPLVNV